MSKKLLILITLLGVSLIPASALAHELVRDQSGGAGALVYIDPDDDPIAGQPATLFFEFPDNTMTAKSSKASLTITDERGAAATVPIKADGSSLSGTYVFPRQGSYQIKLEIEQAGKARHVFSLSQQISRGAASDAQPNQAPAWAVAGTAATVLGVLLLAILARKHHKAIRQYSRF